MAVSIKRVKDNPELADKPFQTIKSGMITQEDESIMKSDEIEKLKKEVQDKNNKKIELQTDNSNL
jgi:hypothetical protein